MTPEDALRVLSDAYWPDTFTAARMSEAVDVLARALPAAPRPEGLDVERLLPTFEVGQVVGDLQPGRRRHDWCSIHGDIGPGESIDAHARAAHGSGAEAIREAQRVIAAAMRLSDTGEGEK